MTITKLIGAALRGRQHKIDKYATEAESIQRNVLQHLIHRADHTEWGTLHRYSEIDCYEQFTTHVPLSDYDGLKTYIDRMRHGERDILWPGRVTWYAKSSGTTNDKSKFIPISREGLDNLHYKGGTDSVALYLRSNPRSNMFGGKALILGGSHAPNYNLPHSLVGDLSAILIENINPFVNLVRVPDKKIALLSDFEEKMERIAHYIKSCNITNLSGVPSWMMAVLRRTLDITGKDNLCQLWPELEVFFHGGVAFTPYREQYKQLIPSSHMHYMETYNASEGFFGLQSDLADPAMLLMIDYDVFYEFIPMDEFGCEHPTIVPLWDVEIGRNYAMVISTSCGLWRYIIGDTVKFTQRDPYKFIITGRTKHFINAFGEELVVDNAERGLRHACEVTGAQVREYTAAPVFMNGNAQCRHQWLIEWATPPADLTAFTTQLDQALQSLNSDYEAKRYKDITLQQLEIIPARHGLFDAWLKAKGKLGGQHKVPRLSNSRDIIDELLQLNHMPEDKTFFYN